MSFPFIFCPAGRREAGMPQVRRLFITRKISGKCLFVPDLKLIK
jgi:hypothetical protein